MTAFAPLLGLLETVPDPRRAEGKVYRLPHGALASFLKSFRKHSPRAPAGAAALLAPLGVVSIPTGASADEGGVSFWAPGLYSSLAAVPIDPGWSWATVYYHTSADAGGGRTFLRGGRFESGLSARGDAVFFGPTYTFATPVLGAQASLSLVGAAGHIDASVDATLTGPHGNTISGQRSDARTVFGDLYPQLTLRWNREVHNVLAYATGNIPIGAYNPNRLANLGIGHGAMDVGGGYTYLNPKTGLELSAVLGFTYNFENADTKYRNGVDMHLDWGASYFVNERTHVGAVGYLYNQITDDSGSGARLGGFRSRVAGLGPQIGYIFSVGERIKGYLNVKTYGEFAEQNRPAGWNAWVTLSFSARGNELASWYT